MRVNINKWGVGVVLTATVLLTGCSGGGTDKATETKPSSGASQEAEAPQSAQSDCPELKDDATVRGEELSACISDAMSDAVGFAATTSVNGIETTARVDLSEKAIESLSPAGSLIAIGDDIWLKSPTSDWQAPDPESSDPYIAALSTRTADITALDPATTATNLSSEFTVTGTGERLGQKVYLLSGTVERQGIPFEMLFEVTDDYLNLASTSAALLDGQSVVVTMEVTEWDVEQEIVAPL